MKKRTSFIGTIDVTMFDCPKDETRAKEEADVKCISNAKFDPKGKSVASGKNITGWL